MSNPTSPKNSKIDHVYLKIHHRFVSRFSCVISVAFCGIFGYPILALAVFEEQQGEFPMSNRHCCIPGHEVRLDPLKFQNFSVDFLGTIFWEGWEVSWLTIYIFHIPIQNDGGDSETPTKTQEKTSLAARWHSLTFILWWLTPALLIDFPSNRNFWNQSFLVQKGQSPAMPFRSLRKDRKMVPRWTWGKKIWVDRSSESQTFV